MGRQEIIHFIIFDTALESVHCVVALHHKNKSDVGGTVEVLVLSKVHELSLVKIFHVT
jgi:hypothetical protein